MSVDPEFAGVDWQSEYVNYTARQPFISLPPRIIGRVEGELVDAISNLTYRRRYSQHNIDDPNLHVAISEATDEIMKISKAERSAVRLLCGKFGIRELFNSNDAEEYHTDRDRIFVSVPTVPNLWAYADGPIFSDICVIGPTTSYITGVVRQGAYKIVSPVGKHRVHTLEEGVVYRFTPVTTHKQAVPKIFTKNRTFWRILHAPDDLEVE